MDCRHKHTDPDPPVGAYICPRCGSEEFGIDVSQNPSCMFLHEEDILVCTDCKLKINGEVFAAIYLGEVRLIKCPHCKGTHIVRARAT